MTSARIAGGSPVAIVAFLKEPGSGGVRAGRFVIGIALAHWEFLAAPSLSQFWRAGL